MTVRTDEVTIAAPLVRFLRSALKRKLSAKVEMLRIELDVQLTTERWKKALDDFNDGCELLACIGLTDDPSQTDVEVDIRRWGPLVLNCVEVEYQDGLRRKHDARRDGFDPSLVGRHVPALGELMKELQRRTGIRPRRGRPMSYLEEQLARRRIGRRRSED